MSSKNRGPIKTGCGKERNSASWAVAYNQECDMYVAMLSFSSAYGCWMSMYEIPKESFDLAGTFEDDDYKTERMIREGRELYKYENERNYPEPYERIADENYRNLCKILLERN